MRIGLGTIVAGRRRHLDRQARAVRRRCGVERYVVVAMDAAPVAVGADRVVRVPAAGEALPLAAARNRAIEQLADCELAILLDVDCIPGDELVARYGAAARSLRGRRSLLCGPVGYLAAGVGDPDPEALAAARRRVVRRFPTSGICPEPRSELFWSLSFAVNPALHAELGGFDEAYTGWGAEDTDYGLRAARAGAGLWLVADAFAYHQHHPPVASARPAEVAANARRFHARWGFWPMPDVLARLAAQGLISWRPDGASCEPVAPARQLRTSFL